jgi:hypothetical protein
VIVLSDWTFLHPHQVIARLKQEGGFFNRPEADAPTARRCVAERTMWADADGPTDIATSPGEPTPSWSTATAPRKVDRALRPGERVRCASSNAAAQTTLQRPHPRPAMTVVDSDGQNVPAGSSRGIPEATRRTYDVIVEPARIRAFTFGCGDDRPRAGPGDGSHRDLGMIAAFRRSHGPTLP